MNRLDPISYKETISAKPHRQMYVATIGVLIVRPPIQVGIALSRCVLGEDDNGLVSLGANLRHVITTEECTVFVGESHRPDSTIEQRQSDIYKMGERIIALANQPELVVEMYREVDPLNFIDKL